MPLGLPFVSLTGEAPAAIEQARTLDRNARELDTERAMGRPWIEPVWDRPAAPAAPTVSDNPLDVLIFQSKTRLDATMGQFKAQREALQKSIDPDIDTAYAAYGIDFQRLQDSTLDAEQKAERAKDLAASYEKKKLGIRAKIQADLEALDLAEQEAKGKIELDRISRQTEIQTYQKLAERGVLDPSIAQAMQFKTLGIDVPVAKQPVAQTPVQRLRELNPVLRVYDTEAQRYRINPKTKRPQQLAPDSEWKGDTATDADWRDISEEEMDRFWQFRREHMALTDAAVQLRRQVINRPVPDLATAARQAASPLAQSVQARRPAAEPNDMSQLSDAELRRLAGM